LEKEDVLKEEVSEVLEEALEQKEEASVKEGISEKLL
jgi:hypothetical protein